MPTGATLQNTSTAGGTSQGTGGSGSQVAASVPFIRASQEHRESAGIDVSRAMTTSDQDLGAFPIPAYGYLRSLILLVTTSGGAGTSVTAQADAPFNALKNIFLQEPNGAVIAQFNTGYDLFLVNKYGGYRYAQDARQSPEYSVSVGAAMNFSFLLRIPVELRNRDALGALPNQNAAAAFQLRLTLAAVGTVFAGTLTTPPTVRIRVYNEEWDQPEAATEGVANQTTPPAMNTTQYWSVQSYPLNAGLNTIRLSRMGNYIRNLIFIYRDGSGVRSINQTNSANWPNPLTVYWDTRPQDLIEVNNWMRQVYERYGYSTIAPGGGAIALDAAGGLDQGVMPYDFCHEFKGQVGFENNDLWLPTLGSTRLEVGGTFGVAGTLYVLTNDVSIAGNVFF